MVGRLAVADGVAEQRSGCVAGVDQLDPVVCLEGVVDPGAVVLRHELVDADGIGTDTVGGSARVDRLAGIARARVDRVAAAGEQATEKDGAELSHVSIVLRKSLADE